MTYIKQFFNTKEYLSNKNYIIKRFNELYEKYKDEIYKTHRLKNVQLFFNNSYESHACWNPTIGITISNFILVNPLTTIDELEDTICHEFGHAITKSYNHTKGWLNNFKRISGNKEKEYLVYVKINFPSFLKRYHGKCPEGCTIETEEIIHNKCKEHNLIIKYSRIF